MSSERVVSGAFPSAGVEGPAVTEAARTAAWNAACVALERDGFARLGSILDPATVQTMKAAIADLESESGTGVGLYGILRHNPWCTYPAFAESVQTPALRQAVRDLLGTESPVLFQDVVVWKLPNTTQRIEWHQDYAYWPLDRPHGVTVWVALDDADAENGCLHYLSGTHREGERAATDFVLREGGRPRQDSAGLLEDRPCREDLSSFEAIHATHDDLPPLDATSREHLAVAVPLRAGEALVHHPLVWHMSPANRSPGHRRAWSLTWLHPDVRWNPVHAPHPYIWSLRPLPGTIVDGDGIWRAGD